MQGEKFVVLKQRLICSFFIFANNETAGKNKALLLYLKEPKKVYNFVRLILKKNFFF